MKRKYKNIINISISVLLIAALVCTCYFGSKSSTSMFTNFDMKEVKGDFDPSAITNGSSSDTTDSSSSTIDNQTTPPEMPSGDTTTDGTRPEMPSGDMNNGGGQMPGNMQGGPDMNNSSDSTTPPEKPDGDTTIDGSVQPTMPSADSTEQPTMPGELPDDFDLSDLGITSELGTLYKVLIIVESIGITLSLVYLFVSKFNLLTFKETFSNKDRVIITILISIVVSAGLSYGAITITNNLISSSTPDFSQMNGKNFFDKDKNMDFSEKV